MKYLSRPNGALVYSVKKDGSLYKNPEFVKFVGSESTAAEVISRLEYWNPGKKFVSAEDVQ